MAKTSDFKVQGNRVLFQRLGSLSPQRQNPPVGRKAPVSRGLWAFPYPLFDLFFAFHQYEQHLPKRLQRSALRALEDDTLQAQRWSEREAALQRVQQRIRPKTFWYEGPLYARISPCGRHTSTSEWWLYPSAKELLKVLRGQLYTLYRWSPESSLCRIRYSADHLEVFIPAVPELAKFKAR